ncbi:MAG: hypothetical protein GF331_10515 [Chitinivibrionales bacterium]|nr:hypothetical protein [Chitinivibrionales bacterium]
MRALQLVLILTACISAQSFNLLYMYSSASGPDSEGLWLVDSETGDKTKLWGKNGRGAVAGARFSPDGARIAFQHANTLYLMNNDGSEAHVATTHEFKADRGTFAYTSNGIFWMQDTEGASNKSDVYRLDLTTGQVTRPLQLERWPDRPSGKGYWASRDGRRAFTWTNLSSAYGATSSTEEAYITWNADFTSAEVVAYRVHGHGNLMTLDGQYLLTCMWGNGDYDHQYVWVVDHADTTVVDTLFNQLPAGNPIGPSTRALIQCANTDEYIGFTRGIWGDMEELVYLWHWQDESVPRLMPKPDGAYLANIWMGPLPASRSLTLSPQEVTLSAAKLSAAVHVAASDDIGTLNATVDAAGAAWLSAVLDGDSLRLTADSTGLGDAQTFVIVAASGISQPEETLTVSYNAQDYFLAKPQSIEAVAVGDSALDVQLSWQDVSVGEDGYAVERRPEGGIWSVIATLPSDAAGYIDERPPKARYTYRVRSFRGGIMSAYSDEVVLTVTGMPWIRFTMIEPAPVAGETLLITWDANLVTEVEIEASYNEGETWEKLTASGSVSAGDDRWSAFPWAVPAIQADSVMLRIHPYQDYTTLTVLTMPLSHTGTRGVGARRIAGPFAVRFDPASGLITVNRQLAGPVRFAVHSLDGRCVARAVLPAGERAVQLAPLAEGTYIVRLGTHAGWIAGSHASARP